MAKKAAERRPVDDHTMATDLKLQSAEASLGFGMGKTRVPDAYRNLPRKKNHGVIPGKK